MNVLYEDEYLLCVNKPPGVSVQRDKTGDIPLEQLVRLSFAGVVHRIDKPVSGVVLFAKTKAALTRLSEQVQKAQWRKVYWAIVGGTPPEQKGELVHFLKKNGRVNKSFVYEKPGEGTKEARLTYACIGSSHRYSFLRIELATGRHHQIRCQLAHLGCPVKGDVKYGSKRSNRDGGIGLHARSIELDHPMSGERLKLTGEPPDDVLWRLFTEAMNDVS